MPARAASHVWRNSAVGVSVVVAITVGVLLALSLDGGAASGGDNVSAQPDYVTAPVERGPLLETLDLSCRAVPEIEYPLPPVSPADGLDPVVTALPLAAGAEVAEGGVLAEVAGRPIFAIAGAFPLYRDLAPGSAGPDVLQLNSALNGLGLLSHSQAKDTFSDATAQAVRTLYDRADYSPPLRPPTPGQSAGSDPTAPVEPVVTVPRAEWTVLPAFPARVESLTAGVGDITTESLMVISAGRTLLDCPVSFEQQPSAASLAIGTAATVSTQGTVRLEGYLSGANAAPPTDQQSGNQAGGSDAGAVDTGKLRFGPGDGTAPLIVGQQYPLSLELRRSGPQSVIVPVSAIWTRASDQPVITVMKAGRRTDVPITIEFDVAGRVAVQPSDPAALAVGDDVLVGQR